MFYTISKGLVWYLLALILGFVIGYLMRSVAAKRQLSRVRATSRPDTGEIDMLRGRIAGLEPLAAERDILQAKLDAALAGATELPVAVVETVAIAETGEDTDGEDTPDEDTDGQDIVNPAALPDADAASTVIGRPIELDDLTVIEGIGPKIAELCINIGIATWEDVASTEVSLLNTMLADAGPRYRTHDPTTWPEQASLLANGRWQEFVEFVERLDGAR